MTAPQYLEEPVDPPRPAPRPRPARAGLHRRVPLDEPWIELLRRIFEKGPPRLEGAACASAPRLFDGETAPDRIAALELCRSSCPVLPACQAWVASVPPSRLVGQVIAGEYRNSQGKPVTHLEHDHLEHVR